MSDALPFSKHHRKGFPFEWRGKVYAASSVTIGIKEQFCDWVLGFSLRYAAKALGAGTQEYKEFQKNLFSGPPTWDVVPSEMTSSAMTVPEGKLLLMRLILNVGPSEMDDRAVLEMMADEHENPAGPFAVVMARLREATDPKATSAGTGATATPAATSTPSSSTNPSGSIPTASGS